MLLNKGEHLSLQDLDAYEIYLNKSIEIKYCDSLLTCLFYRFSVQINPKLKTLKI